ncbi:MAG TPA: SDR family NAD(P)-dependent oxidoreductase [Chloroflexota bacterium]
MKAGRDTWRDLSFTGRSAVVTGAARGIGRAVAYRLAGLGARTVIWDRDGEEAERAAISLRDRLHAQDRPHQLAWAQVDVSDPQPLRTPVPQRSQNRAFAGLSAPHTGHTSSKAVPQAVQYREPVAC